jgi:hypothetical protein
MFMHIKRMFVYLASHAYSRLTLDGSVDGSVDGNMDGKVDGKDGRVDDSIYIGFCT